MKQSKIAKLAYAAGFIDGEGFIGLVKENRTIPRGKSIQHTLRVCIGQQDGEIMDWLVGNFGGYIHNVKRDNSYMWQITTKKAYYFLKQIEPFLKYKRPQARLAIRYYERFLIGNEKRRYQQLSQNELDKRELLYLELKDLKKVFKKPVSFNGAALETKRENSDKEML